MSKEVSPRELLYTFHVKPGSKKGSLIEANEQGEFVVYVRERAVGGEANRAVQALLAKHLGVPKTRLTLVRGHTSRIKIFSLLAVG